MRSLFTVTALGQQHIPGAGGNSLCGVRLSGVAAERPLPECGFCTNYAMAPRIVHQATRRAENKMRKRKKAEVKL